MQEILGVDPDTIKWVTTVTAGVFSIAASAPVAARRILNVISAWNAKSAERRARALVREFLLITYLHEKPAAMAAYCAKELGLLLLLLGVEVLVVAVPLSGAMLTRWMVTLSITECILFIMVLRVSALARTFRRDFTNLRLKEIRRLLVKSGLSPSEVEKRLKQLGVNLDFDRYQTKNPFDAGI